MKTNIKLSLAALALTFSATAMAQLNGSYFLEGALYRHELNPAFVGEQGYVSFPTLGNLNVRMGGNIGIENLFFKRNVNGKDRLVTFLHPEVSVEDALSGINSRNKLLMNLSMPVISVGFKAFGGFNTVGLNVRTYAGLRFGDDLFEMLKDLQNKSYNIGEVSAQAQAYVELALGHSRRIDENWSVGGKFKLLFGAARANLALDDLTLNLASPTEWTATAHAEGEVNVKGLEITSKYEKYKDESKNTKTNPKTGEKYGYETIDEVNYDSPGLGGFGVAFDLGAEYDFKDLVSGLKASLALLDLGFISWNESHVIENNGEKFTFEGFKDIKIKDGNAQNKTMSEKTDELSDKLQDLYHLDNKGNTGGSTHGIGATMNIGVEYTLPVYDKVRFGLLSSTRFQGDYTWNEERLSVNYAPCNWFDMSISGAVGTFGGSFGWVLNLHPVGFNFFLGMDHTLGSIAKQGIPLGSDADFTMGINFPFNWAPQKESKKKKLSALDELDNLPAVPAQQPQQSQQPQQPQQNS